MLYFETERLILRDYSENDFEAYYKLKSDPETMYYLQDIKLSTKEEARTDFEQVLCDRKEPDREFYFLHMEEKETGEQIGSIGYNVVDRTPVGKLVHVGYFTYPRFWGRGYTTEALRRVLEFAFMEDQVYRVTTGCLAENKGSERVMQKNGLIKEAEHIDYEWHDGKMKTRLEYRLLKREWQAQNISIRELMPEDEEKALDLVWRVFQEYEAPDYTKEGVEEFYKSIHDESYLSMLRMYGAFIRDKMIGVIATRSEGTHIALFFVEGEYHRQGIGKQLFQMVRTNCPLDRMTVNSSPYAVPVYHKLGFRDVDTEKVVCGLRFTPMELR